MLRKLKLDSLHFQMSFKSPIFLASILSWNSNEGCYKTGWNNKKK